MGDVAASKSLQELLAGQLPKHAPFTFYHYSTPPSKSPALYNAPPHRKPERTYCESHFLAASIVPKDSTDARLPDELLVLAIEVLIYTTKQLTTIFVSKADSTGYLSTLNLPRSQAGSPLKAICGTFVSWLAQERQRDGKRLVVSLFARAQDQYLFPASIDNPNKHVLDDRGLVKWWCKVLDPIVGAYAPEPEKKSLTDRLTESEVRGKSESSLLETNNTAKGYLVIPGFDSYDILRYTPAPPSSTPRRWAATHPLAQIAPYPAAPPRCLVPNFPDDPKSRFLSELDEELPDARGEEMSQAGGTPSRSNGQWRSVRTLEQFWEMMAFRQECSSGRIVGFIWVVITPRNPSIPEEDEDEPSRSQIRNDSQHSISVPTTSPRKRTSPKKTRRRKLNTESGPIPLILPRIKSSSSNLSTASVSSSNGSAKLPPATSPYYTWPATSRGTVLFSTTVYNRALEILLQQNFATQSAAGRSTKRWRDEVAVLGGVEQWSWTILGRKQVTAAAVPISNCVIAVTVMGVRKKRKTDASTEEEKEKDASNVVQVLGDGQVRKKPKIDETTPNAIKGGTNGVNTLGAGLIRKKPKS
ncbi:DNA damage response protein-like protein Rtt109 [Lophiostoma macrostomum CBS 122681]|uniref:histone acetyltransferase n=1 Tax=Lophiostoma macrostomum CBS 122681 TaxID=1314788 RepID=A0A6A6SYH5_9PLEO|nr:DNA damage response protein-like protein Rtt109 [Lophiostoma macrostomum CBS 122681]